MPYLAYDLDALKRVPAAARAAGVAESELGFGLVRLWEHCWSEKTDHVQAAHICGFFGGERNRVTEALAAFRFLEPDGEAFRVRGADRYLRIRKSRSEAGKKASANLRRAVQPIEPLAEQVPNTCLALAEQVLDTCRTPVPALTPSTEHRAPNKKLLLQAAVAEKIPEPEDFEADSSGEYQPTAWGFWGWHNQERRAAELFDEPTPPTTLRKWHDTSVAKVEIPGLIRAYRAYLHDRAFGDKGWPFAVFMAESVWLTRANKLPKPARRL